LRAPRAILDEAGFSVSDLQRPAEPPQPSRPPRVGSLREAAIALPAWSVSQFGPSFAARPVCLGAFTLFRTQRSGIDRRTRCAAV